MRCNHLDVKLRNLVLVINTGLSRQLPKPKAFELKIAVITDIHGNAHSLNAVLEHISSEKPDFIAGAGDMVGCSIYPGGMDVWSTIHNQEIPFVMGNEEQRIVHFFDPLGDPCLKHSVKFMPLQYRARQFTEDDIAVMSALPLGILLDAPGNQDVFICHASPNNLHKSPRQGIDAQMEHELEAVHAKIIVVGHLHTTWHQDWKGKLLVMAGSAGLPLRGKLDEVDYLMLTFQKQNWQFEYKSVKYDYKAALEDVIESDAVEQSGPIGWLMLDEILTQEDRLMPFFSEYCPADGPDDLESWEKLAIGYLEQIQRWDVVKPYVQHLLY